MFHAGIDAVRPTASIQRHLPEPPRGRTLVAGVGKAAGAMAAAVEEAWDGPLDGLVTVPYGHGVPCKRIEVIEASHPVPDSAGSRAARRILALVEKLGHDDLLLFLISGGASALLTVPTPGVHLRDKRAVTKALLRSGATISEINCVRKHLSAIKGGQLALAAQPARVVTLMISDVPGDDPSVIGSGPTVGDPTTFAQARKILAKYRIRGPARVQACLEGNAPETPTPDALHHAENIIIARPQDALEAAAKVAREAGFFPMILSDSLEGEATDAALAHAAIVRQVIRYRQPAPPPLVLLSGGETTVTLRGSGSGGRNTEFLLAAATALAGERIYAIACDTDGIDGDGGHAGAIIDPTTADRATQLELDPREFLARQDSRSFFDALGDLVTTKPTRTNVNDFRTFLVT